uniref:EGF-like domain-containing protein n=1 Tax=Strigamia maritima TaxID=126957 RepID=T1IR86_STRMM
MALLTSLFDGKKLEYQITVETTACENGATPTQYLILSELKFPNTSMKTAASGLRVPNAAKRILVPMPFTGRTKANLQSPVCWPQLPLVRKTFPGNFLFEYVRSAPENGSLPTKLNLNNSRPAVLAFPIQPILDIGGTLTLEIGIDHSVNNTLQNVSVTACLDKGTRPKVLSPANCSSGVGIQANTSSEAGRASLVMVPYPEPGNWYVTLEAICYHLDRGPNEITRVKCDSNTTSIVFNVMSASCVYGGCGPYGRCYQYISGGFIFSTCVCTAGWRGWGCTDGSTASSDFELLLATLLLTLSNLLFLPTIALAIYRHYYTEALVYFFTMFFSTFYHACDEEAYTFCLMRLSVMQFCDFYSAILSFWITVIAMADLPSSLTSLAHMAGSLGIAVGVEYDRTGLWVFVVPAATGVIIMIASWVFHCYKQHSCYPKKTVWICLVPGVVLVATGLVCFAFLETKDNYKYVHSSWHAATALCVLFLLPPRRDRKGRPKVGGRCMSMSPSRSSYIRADDIRFAPDNSGAGDSLLSYA